LAFSRRRDELLTRLVGAASGAIVSSGQSLAEGWCGNSAIGFGSSRHRIGCRCSASTSARD